MIWSHCNVWDLRKSMQFPTSNQLRLLSHGEVLISAKRTSVQCRVGPHPMGSGESDSNHLGSGTELANGDSTPNMIYLDLGRRSFLVSIFRRICNMDNQCCGKMWRAERGSSTARAGALPIQAQQLRIGVTTGACMAELYTISAAA